MATWNDFIMSNEFRSSLEKSIVEVGNDILIQNTRPTGSVILRLGTATTATDFQVQNSAGVSLLTVDGSGVSSLGTGGIALGDNENLILGTGSDLTAVHNGTNTVFTSTTGNLTIDNTNVTGQTIFDLGTDTAATSFRVRNNTGTYSLLVDGLGDVEFSITAPAIAQATNISTGVTLNRRHGIITTQAASAAAGASHTFTVTNSTAAAATSAIVAQIIDYSGAFTTNGLPIVSIDNRGAGSFDVVVSNAHGANALSGTLAIAFWVLCRGV